LDRAEAHREIPHRTPLCGSSISLDREDNPDRQNVIPWMGEKEAKTA
jgi:hypothetical protein